uniref:MBL fold metallo-hydrolase n=1 Tax=Alicyclobacillus tolerans TaxID=90970 RepID=UPI001F183886|nr:MBL fold metallo-hydrolase [Alicyclobacillus tolerans]
MEVTMLGGTEIGATCLWCKTDSTQWLIDAGVRMNERDALPNLAHLEANDARIDAIFVTHAHQDHIGALPLVSAMFPDAPVYMTKATLDIARVMLADAFKLSQQVEHMGVFSEEQLEALWQRVRVMGQDKVFGWKGVRVSTYSAGHILGAVAIGFETNGEGSLLFTGDFSSTPTRLIGGLRIPRGVSYNMVVTESTYGSRLHESRAVQERALAAQVADVIQNGGHVLIPAFAVGRAQEILMILQDAIRFNKDIRPFPIVVDGLVRSICPIYESYPELLQGPAKRLLRTSGRLFSADYVRLVKTLDQRQQIVLGEPCCIISSSGMLSGGPSVFYANALVRNSNNAVFLCGYQDEESPGRLLLDMAQQPEEERKWILSDRVVPVRARVGFYGLSAHADRRELVQAVSDLRPYQVLLVHGDSEAKDKLQEAIAGVLHRTDVQSAEIGHTYHVEPSQGRHSGSFALPTEEQPVRATSWKNHVLMFRHHDVLTLGICKRMDGGSMWVRLEDSSVIRIPVGLVLESLGYVPAGEDPTMYMRGLRDAAEVCIQEGRLYGFRPAERFGYAIAEECGLLVPVQPYVADTVQEWLHPYGWREIKPDEATKVLKVYVSFPWAVPHELLKRIHDLETHGWRYQVQPHIYPVALNVLVSNVARELDVQPSVPKIYPQEHRIVVPILGKLTDVQRKHLISAIVERTGGVVHVQEMKAPPPSSTSPEHITESLSRMEQNEALRRVKLQIPDSFQLQKAGLDALAGVIRVSVAFPDVVVDTPAAREFAACIERETGWRLEWQHVTNQRMLSQLAIALIQEQGGQVRGTPSLLTQQHIVRVALSVPMDDEATQRVPGAFHAQTGWSLEIQGHEPKTSDKLGAGRLDATNPVSEPEPRSSGKNRMEVNRALQWIESESVKLGIEVYRKSVRGDLIELTFITPEFGEGQKEWLEHLTVETGWMVRVADRVQQQSLIALTESLCTSLGLMKTPSVYLDKRQVGVRTEQPLSQDILKKFETATRWSLQSV